MNAQSLLEKILALQNKPVDTPTAPPPELVAMVVRWGRELCQWKATTLADFAGVSLSSVERIERGEKVSDETLDRVAQALGHDPGAFTTPRFPIGRQQAADSIIDSLGNLEPVAVEPMRTHKSVRDAARCDAYLVHCPNVPESLEPDIANLREWLGLASFILADFIETSTPPERGRRDLYNDILGCIACIERQGFTVLSGTMPAPQRNLPDFKVAVVSVTPRATDPGAAKRHHVLVDRRSVDITNMSFGDDRGRPG